MYSYTLRTFCLLFKVVIKIRCRTSASVRYVNFLNVAMWQSGDVAELIQVNSDRRTTSSEQSGNRLGAERQQARSRAATGSEWSGSKLNPEYLLILTEKRGLKFCGSVFFVYLCT